MSSEEQIFLSEIEAAPQRLDRRLIYADWLEERGDPRAEFIQIWHEMESLKPWADRYLELLRRRQTLREEMDETWLKRLGYQYQYLPMLAEMPGSRSSRWNLLTAFLEVWRGRVTEKDQVSESVIQSTERRLGQPLPAALKEWYRHSGYAKDVWTNLKEPGELQTFSNIEWLEIGFHAVVTRIADFGMSDPPVFSRGGGDRSTLKSLGATISEFAISEAFHAVASSSRLPGWVAYSLSNPMQYVPAEFHPIAFRTLSSDGSNEFLEAPDALISRASNALYITAFSQDIVDQTVQNWPKQRAECRRNGEWIDVPDERRFVPGVSDIHL